MTDDRKKNHRLSATIHCLVPYVAGEGPRLFDDAGKSRQLDLLSSTAFSSGLQLDYRRHR
jgi:hypothetical protein